MIESKIRSNSIVEILEYIAHFFYTFRKLVLICGERLFSAISKMWSIIFVPYQKVEKNAFEGMRQEKKKNYRRPDLNRGPKEW